MMFPFFRWNAGSGPDAVTILVIESWTHCDLFGAGGPCSMSSTPGGLMSWIAVVGEREVDEIADDQRTA